MVHPGVIATEAPEHHAARIEIIRQRLREQPNDTRAAARGFAELFKEQARELWEGKMPNEPGPLSQYENLRNFFEQMAGGLAELADALDRASEPIFLGKAAEIVHGLQGITLQWLEKIGTDVIDIPFRAGILCGGIAFLHGLGADSAAAIAALWSVCRGKKDKSGD
jgi:hypothetical protein